MCICLKIAEISHVLVNSFAKYKKFFVFLLLTLISFHLNHIILLLEFLNFIINEQQIKCTYHTIYSVPYINKLINIKQCL